MLVSRMRATLIVGSVAVAASLLVAPMAGASSAVAVPPTGAAVAVSATPAVSSPLAALPIGAAPTVVPYGIGSTVYYAGHVFSLGQAFTPYGAVPEEFNRLVAGGGIVWTQFTVHGHSGCVPMLGRFSLRYTWRKVSGPDLGACGDRFDVTTTNIAAIPGCVAAYPFPPVLPIPYSYPPTYPQLGLCENTVTAAGARFVVREIDVNTGAQLGTFLWWPDLTSRPQRLPLAYQAVGRLGVGWLGDRLDKFCWQVAPADNPAALRTARLCSMTTPLLSADGDTAILVQSGRVRAVNAITGATVSVAQLPGITTSTWLPGVRDEVPATWENAGFYLVNVAYNGTLGLVRCSITTGRCTTAVHSSTRPGVTSIVTERGAPDAVALN